MSAANGTQRDIGLDLTRILAFLAVPSVHFFLNSTYYDTAIVGPRMALMTVMRTAFMVCVPLYMLLSGYLSAGKHIPLTRPGLLGYYKKLLPIFLTYALSTGVILLYRALWLGEEQTIRSAVKNLLSFQQYSWYMNMYFGLLLLTPFLNALWQSLATPAARRALLAVLLVLTVLPGMVNIYNLHSAETLLHPWLSTSYDQLVPDWWQRLYPITYYFLGGYLRAHVDIKRLRTGQLGLPRLGGDGRCDDGGAVAVAGVVLHDEHRTHAALLTAHHRAEIGIVDLSTSDIGIHKVHTPPEEVPAAAGQLHSPTQPPDLYAAGENP